MKVILATDGSECSEAAAAFLTRLQFTPQDEIILLHVVSAIPFQDDYHAQVKQAIRRVAPKILSSAAEILKPLKTNIARVEQEGYPDTTIIEYAAACNADLIVMGARGVKGVRLLFLGSSTRAVAINSPKPVLVIKRPAGRPAGRMKVLFATDGSDAAHSAGQVLATMPLPTDTELTMIHIIFSPVSDIPEKFIMEINDRIKQETADTRAHDFEEAERIFQTSRTYLGTRFQDIHTQTKIGDPSLEILNAEKLIEPDIIAIGCRGLRGIKGMMGSVSRRILGHSQTSVLIGKTCPETS